MKRPIPNIITLILFFGLLPKSGAAQNTVPNAKFLMYSFSSSGPPSLWAGVDSTSITRENPDTTHFELISTKGTTSFIKVGDSIYHLSVNGNNSYLVYDYSLQLGDTFRAMDNRIVIVLDSIKKEIFNKS